MHDCEACEGLPEQRNRRGVIARVAERHAKIDDVAQCVRVLRAQHPPLTLERLPVYYGDYASV